MSLDIEFLGILEAETDFKVGVCLIFRAFVVCKGRCCEWMRGLRLGQWGNGSGVAAGGDFGSWHGLWMAGNQTQEKEVKGKTGWQQEQVQILS